MKKLFFTTIFFLTMQLAFANEIDSLKSIADVQQFLIQKIDKDWKFHKLFDPTIIDTAAYGKNKFFKLDLDNNGLTDLIINGDPLLVITDKGHDKYNSYNLDMGAFRRFTLKNIVYKERIPLLLLKRYDDTDPFLRDTAIRTIVFKFDGFFEYNPAPKSLKIDEIVVSTSICFGECPVFDLLIKANRSANYEPDHKQQFKGIIDEEVYNKLILALNYISLPSLKDKYKAPWTDDQTIYLKIKYNNGQIKNIEDYGSVGTFGLRSVYQQIFSLVRTQKWEKDEK